MRLTTTTTAVHAGRDDLRALGVHALPLDLSTTNPLNDAGRAEAALDALLAGDNPEREGSDAVYGRLHNPTVARFERGLAALEGAEAAVAFSSGMAALTACLLSMGTGHVVAIRPIYGGSDHLLASGLLPLEVTWSDAKRAADAIRTDTRVVVVETPANPTLALVDIGALCTAVAPVPVLVDNTLATPVLQRPLEQGATFTLHSATKAIGGHGDALGGVIATGTARARALRKVRIATGAVLHPLSAYLLHRGLATLPLRVRAAEATAGTLARRLQEHPGVVRVEYPGLPGGDPGGLIGHQMDGPGSLLAFEVPGGAGGADTFVAHLRLITPAVSLGTTDSLIQRPAALTHRVVAAGDRERSGISSGLLRLSVGLEDADDLWDDLDATLAAIGP